MKKPVFFLILFLYSALSIAQDDDFKTIFSKEEGKPIKISGFGGPMMSFGAIDGEYAHMMGGGGGVIINNFFFGGYGMGLTTQNYYKNQGGSILDSTYLGYGHGGFWLGYIISPHNAIHISISSMIGWGSINELQGDDLMEVTVHDYPVFVLTPLLEVELNFSKFFKVGVGSCFSIVQELKYDSGYSKKDFITPTGFLSFKFGWFD